MKKLIFAVAIFLVGMVLSSMASAQKVIKDDEAVMLYDEIEVKPKFKGKEAQHFAMWVYDNIVYPEECVKERIEGKVVVQFVIEKDGKVSDVVLSAVAHHLLNQEAYRVVSSSPKWEPGIQKGKPVCVKYTFPIIFKLNDPTPPKRLKH